MLKLRPGSFAEAEAECNSAGGHLAAFASREEQVGGWVVGATGAQALEHWRWRRPPGAQATCPVPASVHQQQMAATARPCPRRLHQVAVEQFYQSGGWLLAAFHQRYWIGLQAGLGARGVGFGWLDRSLPSGWRTPAPAAPPRRALHLHPAACSSPPPPPPAAATT
jgi:hypothetical protein